MKQLDHQINLDRAVGAEDNASQGVTPMRNSSKKTPWHMRFARVVKLKEIGATAGFATIYGLLFAGLLFAPLLPHLASQSNSPTNNSPTNSFPQPPPGPRIFGEGNWDAMDCDDCDTVYDEKIAELTDTRDDAIDDETAKYSAAIQNATQNYKTAVLNWKTQGSTAIWPRPTPNFWSGWKPNAEPTLYRARLQCGAALLMWGRGLCKE